MSVYNETFELGLGDRLYNFISNKLDKDTGSYFDGKPENSRQIINGAMKVISGLDWLNKEIHLPNKLIDYCLTNKPEFEGCDLVDYVYVLYKCSEQSTYRKRDKQYFIRCFRLFKTFISQGRKRLFLLCK